MFGCFFPSPRAFGISAVAWAFAALLFWYFVAGDWGDPTGLSGLVGADERAVWVYVYSFFAYAAFAVFWMAFRPHPWSRWSVAGSALIVFVTWFQVQLDVMINEWF
ncbi:MAG: peptide transporter, partial [Gammaproteobacteria bacterium]|nr:peptide transporter [Gammaproteobacteria bacterium]